MNSRYIDKKTTTRTTHLDRYSHTSPNTAAHDAHSLQSYNIIKKQKQKHQNEHMQKCKQNKQQDLIGVTECWKQRVKREVEEGNKINNQRAEK